MISKPTLDELAGLPQMEIEVCGRSYQFSELTMAAIARLQMVIKRRSPHPIEAVEAIVSDMPKTLQDVAYWETIKSGLMWPPRYESKEGFGLLLGDMDGQAEIVREGLKAAHPATTVVEARRIIEAVAEQDRVRAVKGKSTMSKAFEVMFGTYDPNKDDDAKPGKGGSSAELGDLAAAAERVLKMRRLDWLQYTPRSLAFFLDAGGKADPFSL